MFENEMFVKLGHFFHVSSSWHHNCDVFRKDWSLIKKKKMVVNGGNGVIEKNLWWWYVVLIQRVVWFPCQGLVIENIQLTG